MAGIALQTVVKMFPNGVRAVDGVDLTIEDGEFMVLVGPSGCGKTTLLRCIAGLEEVTDGAIFIGDSDVTDVPPKHRDIAMVFQNYALYPHMTVRRNIAYGLKVRRTPRKEIAKRIEETARLLGLEDLMDRRPLALSGGQRQRVAMGRAIARRPAVYLMDEPLSNLDAKLRVRVRADLARLHSQLGVTTVYVTHDQVEAMTLGQRVAVLRDGVLQQVDTPQRLFREPANLFVAAFIGSPSMNLVEADVAEGRLRFAGHELPLPEGTRLEAHRVIVGVRPTDFRESADADPSLPRLRVRASLVEDLGAESHVMFSLDAPRVVAEALKGVEDMDEEEGLLADDNRARFTARIDGQHVVTPGMEIELAVDPARLHFFDPASGAVLGRAARAPAAV